MPKNRNSSSGTLRLDQAGKQGKVIVLNQDECPFRARNLIENGLRKLLIDVFVTLPIRGAKNGTRVSDMAEGPNSFVRETIVVALLIFLREPDAPQRVVRMIRWNSHVVFCVDHLTIRIRRPMGDPCAVAGV